MVGGGNFQICFLNFHPDPGGRFSPIFDLRIFFKGVETTNYRYVAYIYIYTLFEIGRVLIFNMSLAQWSIHSLTRKITAEVRELKRLLAKKLGVPRFRQRLLQEDHSVCGDDESQVLPGTLQLLGYFAIKKKEKDSQIVGILHMFHPLETAAWFV